MKLYINPDSASTNFSPKMADFNELLSKISFEDKPNDIPVNVGLTIRTVNSNEVLCNKDKEIVLTTPLQPLGFEVSTFAIIFSVKNILEGYNLTSSYMQLDTHIQAIGHYIDETQDSFTIYLHLLIKDDSLLINELAEKLESEWVKIEDLSLHSDVYCPKIVLPTLKIVG